MRGRTERAAAGRAAEATACAGEWSAPGGGEGCGVGVGLRRSAHSRRHPTVSLAQHLPAPLPSRAAALFSALFSGDISEHLTRYFSRDNSRNESGVLTRDNSRNDFRDITEHISGGLTGGETAAAADPVRDGAEHGDQVLVSLSPHAQLADLPAERDGQHRAVLPLLSHHPRRVHPV